MSITYTERLYGNQQNSFSRPERGAALVLALMLLLFVSLLGGALLFTATLDLKVGDNYRMNEQAFYLAEAGIDNAREVLRQAGPALSPTLVRAAGVNGTLAVFSDLASMLASDDLPLIPNLGSQRSSGSAIYDAAGNPAGNYWVWVRNDVADGEASTSDTNQTLDLLSVASVGNATKTLEVIVKKCGFPSTPGTLTLDGPVGLFNPSVSHAFQILGHDAGAANQSVDSIAVVSSADATYVSSQIPSSLQSSYTGVSPTTPDVQNVSSALATQFGSVSGLEALVNSVLSNATDVFNPIAGAAQLITNLGSPSDYRVAVVNGDCMLGPGVGYGILVCRGEISVVANFSWTGLIVAIGQGVIRWSASAPSAFNGAVFLARTRAADRSAINPLGSILASRGAVTADFGAAGGPGLQYNTTAAANANQTFPFAVISFKQD